MRLWYYQHFLIYTDFFQISRFEYLESSYTFFNECHMEAKVHYVHCMKWFTAHEGVSETRTDTDELAKKALTKDLDDVMELLHLYSEELSAKNSTQLKKKHQQECEREGIA
jgi:hypothetical protein